MGTNYYSIDRRLDDDFDFNTFWENKGTEGILHIGKSSGGWCFALHAIPERGINCLNDWIELFLSPDRRIINEYQEDVTWVEMIDIITRRKGINGRELNRHPQRHPLGVHCVAHGEGTWDMITGEFS